MSDDSRTETASTPRRRRPRRRWRRRGGAAGAGGAYAATRALHEEQPDHGAPRSADAGRTTSVAARAGRPRRRLRTDTAPRRHADRGRRTADGTATRTRRADATTRPMSTAARGPLRWAEMTVIATPSPTPRPSRSWRRTRPRRSARRTPTPTSRRRPSATDRDERRRPPRSDQHEAPPRRATTTRPGRGRRAVAETDDTDRSAADVAEEPTEERYDPTPTRDWAADEGELLEETHDRASASRPSAGRASPAATTRHDARHRRTPTRRRHGIRRRESDGIRRACRRHHGGAGPGPADLRASTSCATAVSGSARPPRSTTAPSRSTTPCRPTATR